MCRVLAVSPAGFYQSRRRVCSARARTDARVLLQVREAYRASAGTYGAPRIHQDLQEAGLHVGKKRVARLMRADGLVARVRRRAWVRTTDSTHTHPIATNLLARQFAVPAVDRVWVSDVTYVPTRLGFLYLAVVLDLASRRVVGWALRDEMSAGLVLEAMQKALVARRPAPGLLHHSDRGAQYASGEYRALLAAHEVRVSMSRRGNCWDNAVAESFLPRSNTSSSAEVPSARVRTRVTPSLRTSKHGTIASDGTRRSSISVQPNTKPSSMMQHNRS
jgi:transposase InsO family protein